VLTAAVAHATWNFFAKQAGDGGPEFVWLYTVVGGIVYAPVAAVAVVVTRPSLGWGDVGLMAGSGLLHVCYFLLLQRGYRDGDLSVVYPLARGTGPLLSALVGVTLLGERPSALAVAGIVAVVGGVLALGLSASGGRDGTDPRRRRTGVGFGLATGVFIATYTLWDAHAVATAAIPVLVFDWGNNLSRMLVLSPAALRRRARVGYAWHEHRRAVLAVGLLSPLAYILVLAALVTTPVSYVAPAREVSIVIGTLLGARVLAEGHVGRRLAASGVVLAGVAALAIG
jgi:drug/metabolite transporter (DMT)-like permease